MFRVLSLAAMLMVVQGAWALNDPTRPSAYKAPSAAKERYQLESILVGDVRKVAVINGKALTEGEKVGSAKVVRIEKNKVQLSRRGKVIELVPERTQVRQEK